MTLIAGCYERFLFGFHHPDSATAVCSCISSSISTNFITPAHRRRFPFLFSPQKQDEPELTRAFCYAAHKGVVKALSSGGPFVASGGADDLVHLYDMKSDKDLGFLINPGEGAVTSLNFFTPKGAYSPTHLLAGCSDGTISVWRAGGGWECMRTLRGHRAEISSIAIHPSGALALTTARDGTLKLWDLVKGRVTFSTKVENEADGVLFGPSGVHYALQAGSLVVFKAVAAAAAAAAADTDGDDDEGVVPVVQMRHTRRVQCMLFGVSDNSSGGGRGGGDDILITGAEDGALRVWSTVTGKLLLHIPRAHATRIKAMTVTYAAPRTTTTENEDETENSTKKSKKKIGKKRKGDDDGDGDHESISYQVPELLATASSDGVIKLWSLRLEVAAALARGTPEAEDGGETACLSQTDTKARLTTLCSVDPVPVMVEKLREQGERRQVLAKKKKKVKKAAATTEEGDGGGGGFEEERKKKFGQKMAAVAVKKKEKAAAGKAQRPPPPPSATKQVAVKVVEKKKEEGFLRKDGTVSFIGEDDQRRQSKKQRQVQLNSERAKKQRAGQQRRANAPGPRSNE